MRHAWPYTPLLGIPALGLALASGHVSNSLNYSTGTFHGCIQRGDSGSSSHPSDQDLNARKNRDKSPAGRTVMTPEQIINHASPKAMAQSTKPRSQWSASARSEVKYWENTFVEVDGYIIASRDEAVESCNCHDPDRVDTHIWFTSDKDADLPQRSTEALVIEISSRSKEAHPNWDQSHLEAAKTRVDGQKRMFRIRGWLMFDQEHHNQLPGTAHPTRATLWEIHPILSIQQMDDSGHWADF